MNELFFSRAQLQVIFLDLLESENFLLESSVDTESSRKYLTGLPPKWFAKLPGDLTFKCHNEKMQTPW